MEQFENLNLETNNDLLGVKQIPEIVSQLKNGNVAS